MLDIGQRAADLTIAAGDAGDGMTSRTSVTPYDARRVSKIATGHSGGYVFGLMLSIPGHHAGD
jgi:hypothetical protein